ncbi:MAG: sulfide/dihydroorotate dehydrogenase-like FAD/NAD-binding protein [Deltaproteobacteria bacterium]|nr:sulfide/dihydroorotate dehydrogenase-like FAD/NAD-binding protein [Deltaproteobacteria bacterium]
MHEIVKASKIGPDVFHFEVIAPKIARKRKAGQFVVLRINETGERIPLTIAGADPGQGTITLVFQVVGKTTAALSALKEGDSIQDIAGPLGKPTHIDNFGTTICVGGGIGIAPLYPIAQALKNAGNRVLTVLGARTKDLFIMEEQMRRVSHEVRICTDDGSYGTKGLVTNVLDEWIKELDNKVDFVMAIGPPIMMKFVAKTTLPYGIKTLVSLNSIMVDGTGMCGCCRVSVGGETKFVCVDGPEFDAHKVDFELLMQRLQAYKEQENQAMEIWRSNHEIPA